jgi:putative ABC transport system substrate-binding protein
MINCRRFLSLGTVLILSASLISCGNETTSGYEPLPQEDDTIYSISVCQDEDNSYYNAIYQGFSDALDDLFGAEHINLTYSVISPEANADAITSIALQQGSQLIFANGSKCLSAAAEATDTLPIVGAGVIDFQSSLHLMGNSNSDWNKKTGTNVTGVSSLSDMEAQLSLLIESTPDLASVGLLYSVDDTTSIYQNQLLEKYLDQAGIPWKEYEISSSEDTVTSTEIIDSTVITPSRRSISSFTEGADIPPESLGGSDLISGLNSPRSVHAAMTSAFWTEELSAANTEPLAEDASTEDIIRYACNECSCLYIPAESSLTDQMQLISQTAEETATPLIGGDTRLGEYTLTCLYSDPYAMGYQAGKMVYRILVNGDAPGDIKVTSSSADSIKLYNQTAAEILDRTFPKSFQEIHDFLETYEPGSDTSRIESSSSGDD